MILIPRRHPYFGMFFCAVPSATNFFTVYSSVPSCPPSLPYPDSFTPPNGLSLISGTQISKLLV